MVVAFPPARSACLELALGADGRHRRLATVEHHGRKVTLGDKWNPPG